jgi:hypothetical protein
MQALLNSIKDVGYIGSEDLADRAPDAVEGARTPCSTAPDHRARAGASLVTQRRKVLDRMIMNAEARRNAGLREIEWHRDSFGAALRQASDDVVEAEFIETSPVQGMQQDAA